MAWFALVSLCLAALCVVPIRVATSQELREDERSSEISVWKRDASSQDPWFFVQEEDENVSLHVYPTPNASSRTFSFNETLLQAECTGWHRQWNRCNILPIDNEEGLEQLILFPVRGGVSIVHFNHGFSSILNYTRIGSSSLPYACHPTTLWRQQNEVHVACLHLNQSTLSDGHGVGECKVYRMMLRLNRSDLSQSYFEGQVQIFIRDYPELLTNFIISDSLQSCFIPGPQFHFAFFDRLYRSIPGRLEANNYYNPFTPRCAYVTEVEHHDNLHISALCNRTQELVNLCTGNIEHLNITTGLSRTCSGSTSTIVNVTSNGFVITNGSSSTPSVVEVDTGSITHTRCIQGDSTAQLIIESNNSTVTVLRTDDLSILTLTTNNTLNGVLAGWVEVWGERRIGFANGTHYLVKDVNCLGGKPLLVLPFLPDLSLQLGDSSVECTEEVPGVQSSSSIMTPTPVSVSTISSSLSSISVTPTPNSGVSSTTTDTVMIQSQTVTIPTSSEQNVPVIAGVTSGLAAAAAVVGLLALLGVVIAIMVKRRRRNGGFSTRQSNPQTTGNVVHNVETSFTTPGATPGSAQRVDDQKNGPQSGTNVPGENHTPDVLPKLDPAEPPNGATPASKVNSNSPASSPESHVPTLDPAEPFNGATPVSKVNSNSPASSPESHVPTLDPAEPPNGATPVSKVNPNSPASPIEGHDSMLPENSGLQKTNSGAGPHGATPSPQHILRVNGAECNAVPHEEEGNSERSQRVYQNVSMTVSQPGGAQRAPREANSMSPQHLPQSHPVQVHQDRNHDSSNTEPVTGTPLPLRLSQQPALSQRPQQLHPSQQQQQQPQLPPQQQQQQQQQSSNPMTGQ